MAVTEGKLSPEEITFTAAAREDTGRHFLDSGGAYGRHHEAEALNGTPIVRLERPGSWGVEAIIETGPFLDEWFRVEREEQAALQAFAEDYGRGAWFDIGRDFMEGEGWELASRDNVYNGENDLSQVYVWELWARPELRGDAFYADDELVRTVVYLHTGCDVRGGYGRPIIVTSRDDEYALPVDLCVGWWPVEVRKLWDWPMHEPRWGPLSRTDGARRFERFSVGYSSAPTYELENETRRVFTWTHNPEEHTVCLELDSGEIAKVAPYCHGPQGSIWHGGEVTP